MKGKHYLKWSVIIAASLIYAAILAIPFLNTVTNKEAKGLLGILTVGEIIVLGILVAILVAAIVFVLKKKERAAKMVSEYESEIKRITWLSWKDTKKSTVVVLIGMVVCAAVISLLDVGLAKGFLAFITLF